MKGKRTRGVDTPGFPRSRRAFRLRATYVSIHLRTLRICKQETVFSGECKVNCSLNVCWRRLFSFLNKQVWLALSCFGTSCCFSIDRLPKRRSLGNQSVQQARRNSGRASSHPDLGHPDFCGHSGRMLWMRVPGRFACGCIGCHVRIVCLRTGLLAATKVRRQD